MIPNPHRTSHNLVLCLDGTGSNHSSTVPSNVVQIFRFLDGGNQRYYYQPGIGAPAPSSLGIMKSPWSWIYSQADVAFALTFELHVKQAYSFLVQNYDPGDRIFVVGFSRGGYTGRVLGGVLEKVGLLRPEMEYLVDGVWNAYCRGNQEEMDELAALGCHKPAVRIHFMGLFDAVNSVGILRNKAYSYSPEFSRINHLRHAVSLDERRAKYKPVVFKPEAEPLLEVSAASRPTGFWQWLSRWLFGGGPCAAGECEDLEEMWFPGDHCDVGGGWSRTADGRILSDMPLLWMADEAAKFGLRFNSSLEDFRKQHTTVARFLSPHHDVLRPPERHELPTTPPEECITGNVGADDATMAERLFWWATEWIPLSDYECRPNMGQYRAVPADCTVHWSVVFRVHYFEDYWAPSLAQIGPQMAQVFGDASLRDCTKMQAKEAHARWQLQQLTDVLLMRM